MESKIKFKSRENPRFFGCGTDESIKAYRLVLESGIDCEVYIVSDVESPEIRDGWVCYTGLREIGEFIEQFKKRSCIEETVFTP